MKMTMNNLGLCLNHNSDGTHTEAIVLSISLCNPDYAFSSPTPHIDGSLWWQPRTGWKAVGPSPGSRTPGSSCTGWKARRCGTLSGRLRKLDWQNQMKNYLIYVLINNSLEICQQLSVFNSFLLQLLKSLHWRNPTANVRKWCNVVVLWSYGGVGEA